MKTATPLPNEAKSPRSLISERSERLHFFISEASSLALAEGDFIEKGLAMQVLFLVGEGGFGPPKSVTTDLQSAPFGRSGIPPC